MIEMEVNKLNIERAWHLVYYIPGYFSGGSITSNILDFKKNRGSIVEKWIKWSKDELEKINIYFDIIIRPLGFDETEGKNNSKNSLDILGEYLAKSFRSIYWSEVFEKNRTIKIENKKLSYEERQKDFNNVYCVKSRKYNLNNKNVLIIDDVCTSGSTINKILKCLRNEWPEGRFYFFCLSKTSYDIEANDFIEQEYFENIVQLKF